MRTAQVCAWSRLKRDNDWSGVTDKLATQHALAWLSVAGNVGGAFASSRPFDAFGALDASKATSEFSIQEGGFNA
jgi:hypothetical protein